MSVTTPNETFGLRQTQHEKERKRSKINFLGGPAFQILESQLKHSNHIRMHHLFIQQTPGGTSAADPGGSKGQDRVL